jgi:hypothetical protein
MQKIHEMSKLTLHDVVTVCDESETDGESHHGYLPCGDGLIIMSV